MTSGVSGAGAGAGAGAPIAETTSTSSASLVAQAQAPPVTRRASALGIVRKRSVTDAAKEAVDEVERRYHPMSQAA
ncbi:hypothetical protein MVLG_02031 [Microbotryum lychnidis-dioicae p1A1 Lamole]|nr:hypothetical protein MVLG_02031 [Microbotryum lychnidis-dioicae p1A1 Lamole]|eukprot:KDE07761.1 hypothetical protein MVLG_02031 [Microbotryum lychnidis-dioicae p1A1 Lamole]